MVTNGPATWRVLINDEAQYALYPERLEIPGGWCARRSLREAIFDSV